MENEKFEIQKQTAMSKSVLSTLELQATWQKNAYPLADLAMFQKRIDVGCLSAQITLTLLVQPLSPISTRF